MPSLLPSTPVDLAPIDLAPADLAPADPTPIDVQDLHRTLAALHSPRRADRDAAAATVLAAPQRHAPPALSALAHALFRRGNPDAALFWYHAGQLRARFDVERCADPTVADVPALLRRQYGGPINRHAFVEADLAVLRGAVRQAVRWDRRTPHDYDHRWINLHGTRAFAEPGQVLPLSRPRAGWRAIAEQVRSDYLHGLRDVLDGLENFAPLGASA